MEVPVCAIWTTPKGTCLILFKVVPPIAETDSTLIYIRNPYINIKVVEKGYDSDARYHRLEDMIIAVKVGYHPLSEQDLPAGDKRW